MIILILILIFWNIVLSWLLITRVLSKKKPYIAINKTGIHIGWKYEYSSHGRYILLFEWSFLGKILKLNFIRDQNEPKKRRCS